MSTDLTFQFPPELNTLLVDTIPVLVKSKRDVLMFFQTAGVALALIADLDRTVRTDAQSTNKYALVREILDRLNRDGQKTVRERREVVRRVVEFETFNSCYSENVDKARGLVAEVRRVVNVKDSFTKMVNAKDEAERKHREEQAAKTTAIQAHNADISRVKADLFALFAMADPHKRGLALEGVLNRLFALHDMHVRDAFTVQGRDRQGTVEQIDGVVEIDGTLYLVEMKWWQEPIPPPDLTWHIHKVNSRGNQCRGIYISYSGYTKGAVLVAQEAIAMGSIITLCGLDWIVHQLTIGADLKTQLKARVSAVLMDKNPNPSTT